MKKMLLATLLLVFSGTASAADTYKCLQDLPFSEFEVLRSRYVVSIDETKDITKEIRKIRPVDVAREVKVSIGTEFENGTGYTEIKNFSTIATSEDVNYTISSVKKNGFSFYLFLDEFDEAGMTLTNADGSKEEIRLICELND
ncbi:MAG: hypothetical protein H7Z71_12255 [Moraxellaceae bacterium]|nr:hypothetical protein [Pseudobdellovibrionaceae bacterium]